MQRPLVVGAAAAGLSAVLALAASWAGLLGPIGVGGTGAYTCPVTRPVPEFHAPTPWPTQPTRPGYAWYGSADLWTVLPRDGEVWHWLDPRPRDDHGISDKSFWWSAHFTSSTSEPQPEIRVTATRLDGPGFWETEPPGTNATAADIGLAILTGLVIPSPGCWQITGEYRGFTLLYVMLVVGDNWERNSLASR